MIIVSDTSPLSALIRLGHLDILQKLFGEIIIPQSVNRELLILEKQGFDLSIYKKVEWIKTKNISNLALVNTLKLDLDEGEAEAIALAKENDAQFLLIDEKKGRQIARSLEVPIVGLLGVFSLAKKAGHLSKIRPILISLKSIGFFVSIELLNQVLEDNGEDAI